MSETYDSKVLARITSHSIPNVQEIVHLFGRRLVRRNLKNFIRVINRLYNDTPLVVEPNCCGIVKYYNYVETENWFKIPLTSPLF